jgi:spermidine/putrescine-binding protein
LGTGPPLRKPEKILHVYNWADYIGESTIRDFEARTGIKVVYDVFDDPSIYLSEEVYQRLAIDRSWSPEQMHAVNRVWTRIKTAR